LMNGLDVSNIEYSEFDRVLGDNIITDKEELKSAAEEVDCIVHLAGIVGMGAVEKNHKLARKVNVDGTKNVLECGRRVIFASVLGGYDGKSVITEETPVSPSHEYFVQKLEAESLVLSDRDNIVLRFGTLYGASQAMRWDLLVHTLIRNGMEMGEFELFQPEVIRPITGLSDVVRAILFFLSSQNNGGGIYNVVTENVSKGRIADTIVENVPEIIGYKGVDERDSEARDYTVSTHKICSLGFSFHSDLALSVQAIAALARREVF